jgi:hypothetical protein
MFDADMKALGFFISFKHEPDKKTPGINYMFLVHVFIYKVDYRQENAVELDKTKQTSNVLNTTQHGARGAVFFR